MPSAERYAARVAAETGHACAECGRRGGRHHYGCRTNMRAIANRPKTCWQAKTMPYGVNPVWLAWIKAPRVKMAAIDEVAEKSSCILQNTV